MSDPGKPFDMPGAAASFEARGGWVLRRLAAEFGLTDIQAAGIVGNLGGESGLKAINEKHPMVHGSRGGFGWAQWTAGRRVAFENWCIAQGLDKVSDEANYGFLVEELRTTQAHTITQVKKTTIIEAAVYTVEAIFERPANLLSGLPARNAFASRALAGAAAPTPTPEPVPVPVPPETLEMQISDIWTWLRSSDLARIKTQLDTIIANQEKIMSDGAKLTQDVADLTATMNDFVAQSDANFKALQDALANNNTAAIEAAMAKIEADNQAMKDAMARDKA
jgi:hypothetical protein